LESFSQVCIQVYLKFFQDVDSKINILFHGQIRLKRG
jgi:hypothetical protein